MGIFSKKIKFVSAICPECNGHLALDARLETAFCQYCGAQCIIEHAPKKSKRHGKLELVLDFVERQQALHRSDRREKEKIKREEKEKEREHEKKNMWIAVLVFGIIIVFSMIMASV